MGAWNKAADCLSRLVELPQDKHNTVQMLTATNHDGPAFHTRSRSTQCNNIEDLTLNHKMDAVTSDIPKVTDTPDAIPKLPSDDRLQALLQMQRTDLFCKYISKHLSSGKALKHEADHFLHFKGFTV